jgi:ADP-heptose:LPS heptosyltransferase
LVLFFKKELFSSLCGTPRTCAAYIMLLRISVAKSRMATTLIKGRLRTALQRLLLTRSAWLARWVLYPNPFRAPVNARTVDIARDAGVGDVLMCTPALRVLRQRNPSARIRFYTNFGVLVEGLPYIDEVHPYAERPAHAKFLEYTNVVPSHVHITRLLGFKLGLDVRDTRPDCIVEKALVVQYEREWANLPRPWVIVLRRASRFTPNKDWPDASWDRLIACMRRSSSVIEIGEGGDGADGAPKEANYVDLRGATSLQQLVAAVAAADIYVGPVSGPAHIATAVGTQAVLVIGGYEHPDNTAYPGNIAHYAQVPCAPCWLREPCPFDLKCLHAITSAQVEASVIQVWERIRSKSAAEPVRRPSIAGVETDA